MPSHPIISELQEHWTIDEIESTSHISSDDEDQDIFMVAEYSDEIFQYMKDLEVRMMPAPNYMVIQTDIDWSQRSILMGWIIRVHHDYGLLPETLYLAVYCVDKLLSYKTVSLGKIQLVGIAAVFIAVKYEENTPLSIRDIANSADYEYTIDEILKAERCMLSILGFDLGWPGPLSFLRRISKADGYDPDTRLLAKYFLEATIIDERFLASPPSCLAASAYCLARLMRLPGTSTSSLNLLWTPAHVHWSGYTWSSLKPVVSDILECCESPQSHHKEVYKKASKKYSGPEVKYVAIFVEEQIERSFTLLTTL